MSVAGATARAPAPEAGTEPPEAPRFALLGPALLLTSGRMAAFAAAFLVPVVLARVFTPVEFGTYKQLFLLYGLLFYVGQLGVATSLFYFVPHAPERAGRYVANAVLLLTASGLACAALLLAGRPAVAWIFGNPALLEHLGPLAVYLLLTIVAVPFEVLLVCGGKYRAASWSYALTDAARALLLVVPVLITGELGALLAGAMAFGGARAVAFLVYLRAQPLAVRPDREAARAQLAYSLPFAATVLVGTLQLNFHQLVVSHSFDVATFAIYAVGCLQVPLVDFLATPTGEVMMVRMAEARRERRAREVLPIWHDSVASLALLFFPLVAFLLVVARELIVLLYTASYEAAVPIFRVWVVGILLETVLVDGVLRVFAQMRFLAANAIFQLALIVALVVPMLRLLGLVGAVAVTVAALAVARGVALFRIARLLEVPVRRTLPLRELGRVAAASAVAAAAARGTLVAVGGPPLVGIAVSGAVFALVYLALVRWWGVAPELDASLTRRVRAIWRGAEAG